MKRTRLIVGRPDRGSALATTLVVLTILAMVVASVLYYAASQQTRSISTARTLTRQSCTESGIQLARTFFEANYSKWNWYLSHPTCYNPVQLPASSTGGLLIPAANPFLPPSYTGPFPTAGQSAIYSCDPPDSNQLFADLDGDGQWDVYIYVRDNADELPPAIGNPMRDNDLAVIVGAVCISQTLSTRLPSGAIDESPLSAEALVLYTASTGGASGSGNTN